MRRSTVLALCLLLLPRLAFGQRAGAAAATPTQKRVIVARVDASSGGAATVQRLRMTIEGVLSLNADVVPSRYWDDAVRRLQVRVRGPDDYGRVAQELDVDAVLEATLQRGEGAWVVTVSVRNGGDGDLLGREDFPVHSTTTFPEIEGGLWQRIGPIVQQANSQLPSVNVQATLSKIPAAPHYRGGGRAPPPTAAAEEPSSETESQPSGPRAPPLGDLLRADIRFGYATRHYQIQLAGETDPRKFDTPSGFPEAGIEAEGAPLNPVGGLLSGVVLHAYYGHSLYLPVRAPSAADPTMTVSIPASWQNFSLDLGYRYPFVVGERTLELAFFFGYGAQQFFLSGVEQVDPAFQIVTVDYRFLTFGPRASIVILPAYNLRAGVSFSGHAGLSAGADARTAFGPATKGGSGWDLAVFATTEIPGVRTFYGGLDFHIVNHGVAFAGGPGTVGEAQTSSDSQIRIDLVAGYRLP